MKRVKAHRTEEEKKTMTSEDKFVMEGDEKANELAKDGAEEDGGAMAAAKALTVKQLRKRIYASTE